MNICSKCQSQFEITPDDLLFYDKVSPIFNGKKFQIPPPTLCPDCRQKRRISFRNERTIYKRTCDRCQKSIISIYAPDKKFTVYCRECWWSEEIDLSNFSIEFDFNKTFTENYQRLSKQAPKVAIEHGDNLENSDFTNHTGDLKNCYLIFAALADEDCLYGSSINNSKNIIDGLAIRNSEICYECVDCIGNYDLMYSQNCANCNNGKFLYNCQSCSNCFLCSNLNNKSYCVRNQKYNREEYQKIMREINLADYSENKKIHSELSALKQSAVRKFINGYNNADCIGDQIFNTKNCKMCFELTNSEDCKFVSYGNGGKDTMDGYAVYPSTELSYEVVATGNNTYNSIFSYLPWTASNILYSNYTFPSCNDCFGCHYVHNQEYSILNKQYTKQEYEELVPRIIEHMQKSTPLSPPYSRGEASEASRGVEWPASRSFSEGWGEFFHPSLSPFGYNETVAQEYFPLTRKQALEQGFNWSDYEAPFPKVEKIIKADELNRDQKFLIPENNDILNYAIECEITKKPFRIIKQELEFYRKHNLPLPKRHPDQRHKDRLSLRNPRKLWDRTCNKCNIPIQTSYSPDRPETVYCEKCYLETVY